MNRVEASDTRWLSRREWLLALLLVAATLVAYLSVWRAGFIWDDDLHLTKNPVIVGHLGFKGIWLTSAATYYPLTLTTFWIEHALWGLNPAPYHVVNVLVHAAGAVLLWRVLGKLGVPGAWLGAALWALHPVQVESVAWITELKNTQSCLFYLMSILFFLKWRDVRGQAGGSSGRWQYALALVCAVLAILSKSSTVMLPVVLGLCLWWMDGRWRWRNLIPLVPFLLISAVASGWTILEQQFYSGATGAEWAQTWTERIIIAGLNIWFYLWKLAWPHPLIFLYPQWEIDASRPLMYLPTLAAVIGLLILWRGRNARLRPFFFAAAYFVVSLFPVLGFFNVYFFRYSFVGDHFQYLASMGPLALAAAGIVTASGFFDRKRMYLGPAVSAALLLSLGALTWRQCAMYSNSESLWRGTISVNPDSWMAQNNLALVLLPTGRVDEAIAHLRKALEIDPDNVETHNNLGHALLQKGRVEESFSHLQKALEMAPNRAAVHYNLGNALLQTGRLDEAIAHLQKALEIDPTYVSAHSDLGAALLQKGRVNESFTHLQRALEIDPNHKAAHFNMANTLLQMGRVDDGVLHLQKALTIDPGDAEAQKNMAWVLATCPEARIRDGAKAVELAERANQLTERRDPIIGVTLAAAYAETGRFADAIRTAETALQLATDSGNAALAELVRAHTELYRSGHPFRDNRQSTVPASTGE